ncbi:GyrI-like domain-containing protein [Lacticaseibacillus daqingensis]|uniref:GyrI-like domain-containing protein n=1 Tax=Lacticaseibacillus daqingensis TaxID=2486014 RepID=UPI000F76C9A8|nr:GyrI-like domain-containing protein [Lacticaseibacillus daqingensis]
MKSEWRKAEKTTYLPKRIALIDVPQMTYVTLNGAGDPNTPAFGEQIQALYVLSYTLRMGLKKGSYGLPPLEYTVYPLEGVWTTSDGSRDSNLNKAALVYKIMIRQPDCVTPAFFETALAQALAKKPVPYLADLRLEQLTDGPCVQTVHVGPYDDEPATFAQLHAFCAAHGLTNSCLLGDYSHREIYLSDARRVAPAKQKTTLRLAVAPQ